MRPRSLAPVLSLLLLALPVAAAPPRLATLQIPGDPRFVRAAREVIHVVFAIDPSVAAGAGLFADAARVPSYEPHHVAQMAVRLDRALRELRAMPWRIWPVDAQIDFRWIYANAVTARRQLVEERIFEHRLAAWLEPLANTLIAFASYAPRDRASVELIWARVPGMLDEMARVAKDITQRDLDTGKNLATALAEMARQDGSRNARRAAGALERVMLALDQSPRREEFVVIGAENYSWRLRNTLLLSMSREELESTARTELARVEAEIASLGSKLPKPAEPTEEERRLATALTRDALLGLYDEIELALREATQAAGFVTIPEGVGPVRARETPEAMIPLTGDGGSMNPPPPFSEITTGYWNVERFRTDWPLETRLEQVVFARRFRENGMGPYAAHEGFPGHHLQLAIARLHKNPIRSILPDPVLNEGWGLYAEEELWRHGGLGETLRAQHAMLRSYRFRIARVIYDINIETGKWHLQQAADFKHRAEPGKGVIDEDVLRAIQWPTQLISYFVGKIQILALREALKAKLGDAYSDRAFHDALLAEGSIPISLIRAKLLAEPVPDL